MKKRGFTLAEVLITLGIIGVVAALTAPQLVMSSRNEATCSRLASTVSNLENAFQNAMVQEGVSGLNQTTIWTAAEGNATAGNLGRYLHLAGNNGNNMITKGGATFTINKTAGTDYNGTATETTIRNAGGTLLFQVGTIDITTGGEQDRPGRNHFQFAVGNDGVLYPVGSRNTAVYTGAGTPNNNNIYNSSSTASGDNACNSTKQTLSCTARIVEDGYSMNY